jgi:hypothetical protein
MSSTPPPSSIPAKCKIVPPKRADNMYGYAASRVGAGTSFSQPSVSSFFGPQPPHKTSAGTAASSSKPVPTLRGIPRVLTQEEDDECLSDDGIDETVDVDVDGKEQSRQPLPKCKMTKTVYSEESGDDGRDAEGADEVEIAEEVDEAETDEQELGMM